MKRFITAVTVLAFALSFAPFAMAEGLQTTAGTMQLGGIGTFNIEMTMPDVGDSVTGYKLNLAPNFGYFIIDNLEISATVLVGVGFGDKYDKAAKTLGFGLGANYYLAVSSFVLHFGAGIGMGFLIPDEGDTQKSLAITAPIGLLMPLNDHVALDLGIQVNYIMSLEDGGNSYFSLPIGYLGVQAFF
ncbi:MAG TPA: hypothetical protein VM425_19085 [Myxococcota bacterium]|nr:hypothetical protein [Myxococcota bacterium]